MELRLLIAMQPVVSARRSKHGLSVQENIREVAMTRNSGRKTTALRGVCLQLVVKLIAFQIYFSAVKLWCLLWKSSLIYSITFVCHNSQELRDYNVLNCVLFPFTCQNLTYCHFP